MPSYYFILVFLSIVSLSNMAIAGAPYQSNYTGQELRIIKSLSADDIEQLRKGKGWGLAKAADHRRKGLDTIQFNTEIEV